MSVEVLLRELAPQVLGAVMRRFRDFAASEDAVQEALLAAASRWHTDGLPENPRAWLIQVAVRRMTDRAGRSDSARRRRETELAAELEDAVPSPDMQSADEQDDTLVLLFMCAHPALTPGSAIALTLRAVGGLTTAEIARAFLVPEATMAQRISRAKQTVKTSGVPFSLPSESEREARLGAVLHVLYLIFNEGYTVSAGPALQRDDLSSEAIRLTRSLHESLAGRCRGRRLARADAAHGCASSRPYRSARRAHPSHRARPNPVGLCRDRPRRWPARRDAAERESRTLSAASGDRRRA